MCQRRVKRIHNNKSPLDRLLNALRDVPQTFEQQIDARALQSLSRIGSNLRAMDDLPDLKDCTIVSSLQLRNDLERTLPTVMSPFNAVHIEGNRTCKWGFALHENKLRVRIDEPLDQPGRGTSVHVHLGPGAID